jgi:hypothetical protein
MNLPAGYNPQQNVSAVIDNTIKFIQLNWKPLLVCYFVVCTLFFIPGYVFNFFYPERYVKPAVRHYTFGFDLEHLPNTGIRFLFAMLSDTAFAATILWFVKLSLQNGVAPSPKQVWDRFKLLYVTYYIAFAIIFIAVIISFALLFIPGLFMMPFAGLTVIIIVFEAAGLGKAKDKATALITGKWKLLMGVFYSCMLPFIIYAAVRYVFNKIFNSLAAPNETVYVIRIIPSYIFRSFMAIPFIGMVFFYLAVTSPIAALPVIDELDQPTVS